jgi:metal-dependent amidase/aminoacylase/carboxypeptidase family protein
MPIINRVAEFHAEMTQWRHQIHAHPETAFEEHETAELVAGLLESFGVSVDRGIARTGVIGTLKGLLPGNRAIALRADMDALHIEEQNEVPHASRHRGRMHDGHTAMLLGAAKHLAETRNFAGTIHFIFQPAEENEGGARLMIEEGVLQRFVARISSRAKSAPRIRYHVRRTYSGRPSSSMRFSDATAMATSVVRRPSVRERSASPITRL